MIVCLGTTPALSRTMEFDALAVDGVNRAVRVYEYAAGKAVNAARAAATLGESVMCISPVGGLTGERFRAAVAEKGAGHRLLPVAASTRLCVTAVDRAAGTSTELIEPSASLSGSEGQQLLRALATTAGINDVTVLSGSLAPGLDAGFYARAIREAHREGGTVILDASGPALMAAIEEEPDFIKINAAELATVEPGRGTDLLTSAAALARRTLGWVIVTRGTESTIAVHANKPPLTISVPNIKAVSAIGSGDSFAGGLAVAIARRLPIEETFALATACASANAMTADAAHFDLATAKRLQSEVRVARITL